MANNKIPSHVGFIPDGNRRWAVDHGLPKWPDFEPQHFEQALAWFKNQDQTLGG